MIRPKLIKLEMTKEKAQKCKESLDIIINNYIQQIEKLRI